MIIGEVIDSILPRIQPKRSNKNSSIIQTSLIGQQSLNHWTGDQDKLLLDLYKQIGLRNISKLLGKKMMDCKGRISFLSMKVIENDLKCHEVLFDQEGHWISDDTNSEPPINTYPKKISTSKSTTKTKRKTQGVITRINLVQTSNPLQQPLEIKIGPPSSLSQKSGMPTIFTNSNPLDFSKFREKQTLPELSSTDTTPDEEYTWGINDTWLKEPINSGVDLEGLDIKFDLGLDPFEDHFTV
jgi:hypothetical protein